MAVRVCGMLTLSSVHVYKGLRRPDRLLAAWKLLPAICADTSNVVCLWSLESVPVQNFF